jgi:hypothetical protein
MLKKEWRDIFLPMLLRLMVGPVLAAIHSVFSGTINATSALLFFIGYAVSVFWVALHMGLNTFHSEFHEHAFEYLLTFPFRRNRLLAVKFATRLSILGFLMLLYIFLQSLLKLILVLPPSSMLNSPLFSPFGFSFMALSLFVIGFFLSLVDWGSARPAIPLLILISQVLLTYILKKPLHALLGTTESIDEISSVLLMVSSGVFFTLSFRKLERGTLGNSWTKINKKSLPLVVCQKIGRSWGLLRNEIGITARSFFYTVLLASVLFILTKVITVTGQQQSRLDPIVSSAAIAAFIIIFFASFSGSGSFYCEFRHKGLEYILTFPLSLRRILAEKFLARIFILTPAVLAYMIFAGSFSERLALGSGFLYYFLRPAYFPFWVLLMLFNGFFISLFEMKNIIAMVSLANLYTIVLVPLAAVAILKRFAISPQDLTVLLYGSGLLLATLILGIVFFRIGRRFDLAAPHRNSKAFGLSLFIAFTLVSLTSLAIIIFI